jgi:hypothetical protein
MRILNLLVEAMCSFTYEELQRFDKFLLSPYFTKKHFNNKKVYELFRILKAYFQHFTGNEASLTKQLQETLSIRKKCMFIASNEVGSILLTHVFPVPTVSFV